MNDIIIKHTKHIMLFINTVTIRFLDTGKQINKALTALYGLPEPEDKREWKYFMNLAGLKHSTNTENMEVFSIEESIMIPFNKENMQLYTKTRDRLFEFGPEYNTLATNYPADISYINGVLNPVDIDVAINAKDGDILNYDSSLIEKQELELIRELEKHIKGFINRWHIKDYMVTDELYLASFLSTLYASLPAKVLNIRLSKLNTNQAHSFFIDNFLESRFRLGEASEVLTPESKLWLYKNLNKLKRSMGTAKNLSEIITNVITANKIGIGVYDLTTSDMEIVEEIDVNLASFTKGETKMVSRALNEYYNIENDDVENVTTIMETELDANKDTSILNDKDNRYVEIIESQLNKLQINSQPTKILDLSAAKKYDFIGIDLYQFILDNWLDIVTSREYKLTTVFKDMNTRESYRLTPKLALAYFIKVIMGDEYAEKVKLNKVNVFSVFDKSVTDEVLFSNLYHKTDLIEVVEYIKGKIPLEPNFRTGDDVTEYLDGVTNLLEVIAIAIANINSSAQTANLKIMRSRWFHSKEVSIYDEDITLKEYLEQNNIVFDVTDTYNRESVVAELIETFMGIEIKSEDEDNKYINSFAEIINKLTSYTTHAITKNVTDETLKVVYSSISSSYSKEPGLILVTDAVVDRTLEENETENDIYADDWYMVCNSRVPRALFNANLIECVPHMVVTESIGTDLKVNHLVDDLLIEFLPTCLDIDNPDIKTESNNYEDKKPIKLYDGNIIDRTMLGDCLTEHVTNTYDDNVLLVSHVSNDLTIEIPNECLDLEYPDINTESNNYSEEDGRVSDNKHVVEDVSICDTKPDMVAVIEEDEFIVNTLDNPILEVNQDCIEIASPNTDVNSNNYVEGEGVVTDNGNIVDKTNIDNCDIFTSVVEVNDDNLIVDSVIDSNPIEVNIDCVDLDNPDVDILSDNYVTDKGKVIENTNIVEDAYLSDNKPITVIDTTEDIEVVDLSDMVVEIDSIELDTDTVEVELESDNYDESLNVKSESQQLDELDINTNRPITVLEDTNSKDLEVSHITDNLIVEANELPVDDYYPENEVTSNTANEEQQVVSDNSLNVDEVNELESYDTLTYTLDSSNLEVGPEIVEVTIDEK